MLARVPEIDAATTVGERRRTREREAERKKTHRKSKSSRERTSE
jgi:hypothetical protein